MFTHVLNTIAVDTLYLLQKVGSRMRSTIEIYREKRRNVESERILVKLEKLHVLYDMRSMRLLLMNEGN